MSEELKLLPCPHCGEIPVLFNYIDVATVQCLSCGMYGPGEDTSEGALAAWNALPRRLRWTKEKPTEPGWYWFRYPNGRKFVWHVSGDVVTSHKGVIMALDKVRILNGEWAGPIPKPSEGGW